MFFRDQLEVRVPSAPAVVQARLANSVDAMRWWNSTKPFQGKIDTTTFRISQRSFQRGSPFVVLFKGILVPGNGDTTIVKVRIRPLAGFVIRWCLWLLPMALLTILASVGTVERLMLGLMWLAGLGMMYWMFDREAQRLKHELILVLQEEPRA